MVFFINYVICYHRQFNDTQATDDLIHERMKFKKKPSLHQSFLFSVIATIIIAVAVIGFRWSVRDFKRFSQETETFKADYLDRQKLMLKSEVDRVFAYIEYARSKTQTRLKKNIKNRVYQTHAIATNIYKTSKGEKNDDEIKRMIADALRPIRYNQGRGYFFIADFDGVNQLYPIDESVEGTSMINRQDLNGNFVVQDMIEIARIKGEDFYEYTWIKPDQPGKEYKKISFVKRFEPYEWFIGTGEYIYDIEKDIKAEILDRIGQIRFEEDGYIFVGTYEGVSLTYPRKNINMWDVEDINGLKIVQELVSVAKSGGGYVEYVIPKFEGQRSALKISYTKSLDEWQWYIGAGKFVDEIDATIQTKRESLRRLIIKQTLETALVLLFALLLIALITRYIAKKTQNSFTVFSKFFEQAVHGSSHVDESELDFAEFINLAESANQMIDLKLAVDEALKKSEEKYRDLVENATVAICVFQNDRFEFFNPVATQLFGYPKDSLYELPPSKTVYPEDIPVVARSRERLQTDSETIDYAHRIVTKDGEIRWISAKAVPIHWDGRPAILVFMSDITEQRHSEEMMIQYEKMMSLGSMAAGVAHELNNPLGGIMQGIQNIKRRISPKLEKNRSAAEKSGVDIDKMLEYFKARKVSSMLDGIDDSAKKAAQIITNMLQFSRKSESNLAPTDIVALIDNTLELAAKDYNIKKKYDFKNIAITKEYDPDIPLVACTETQIEQVILNILKNAAWATCSKGEKDYQPRITIRLKTAIDIIQIEIEDNGPGMDETTRKKLFEPFFTTKPVGEGTGLGLSVSYMIIVNHHHGTMEVESTPGKGTLFIIQLPINAKGGEV